MFPCFYCPFDSIYKCSNSHSSWFLYKPARPVEKIFITSYVLWFFPVVYSLIQLIYNSVKAYWHFVHCWFIRFESAAFRQARCDEHQERELCASCPRCKKKVMSQVKMINSTFYLVPYGDSKAFVPFSSYFFLSAWRPKKKDKWKYVTSMQVKCKWCFMKNAKEGWRKSKDLIYRWCRWLFGETRS